MEVQAEPKMVAEARDYGDGSLYGKTYTSTSENNTLTALTITFLPFLVNPPSVEYFSGSWIHPKCDIVSITVSDTVNIGVLENLRG